MTELLARSPAPWALRLVPPFPAVAHRILAVIGKNNVHFAELAELVKMDPSFSAELLRIANSALFGVPREVTSLSNAIAMIGMDRMKTMAIMVAMNRMVRSSVKVDALRKVWVHSLVTALIADEAARITRADQDRAYTAGLLHNLGTLGLMSAYPDDYSRMLAVSDDFGFDLLRTERDLFEIDHCAAGAYLAQDWDFPDELAAAIATHHDEPVKEEDSLDNLIKVSWRLADVLGYAAFSPGKAWKWEELVTYLPGGPFFPKRPASWITESPEAATAKLKELLTGALG